MFNADLPVHGDAEEVEDGGGGEDDIHGVVNIAEPHGKQPVAIQDDLDGVENHCANRYR